MNVLLQRLKHNQYGMFGVMFVDNRPYCMTLERPWLDNQRNISCIPSGIYKVVPHNGAKYKGVWRLENVPNRAGILIHAGNTMKDTDGCILVGDGTMVTGVSHSRIALDRMRRDFPANFTLQISNMY
jgi:hypothetical protein